MEEFKRFLGPRWFYTDDPDEVPDHIAEKMSDEAGVELDSDEFVAACWVDQWLNRGNNFVVVSADEVVVKHSTALEQHLIEDLTGVERSAKWGVVLKSPGNSSNLFEVVLAPHKELVEHMFHIVNDEWKQVRKARRKRRRKQRN